jgi:outer membrane receptor protein involved in Fe transport
MRAASSTIVKAAPQRPDFSRIAKMTATIASQSSTGSDRTTTVALCLGSSCSDRGVRAPQPFAYNDLQLDRSIVAWDTNVTLGMNNAFGVMPPTSYANAPINFDIYTYDVMGRYFLIRLTKKFY